MMRLLWGAFEMKSWERLTANRHLEGRKKGGKGKVE
jgi:hypothetical protein